MGKGEGRKENGLIFFEYPRSEGTPPGLAESKEYGNGELCRIRIRATT
jgi:hypothetical protein